MVESRLENRRFKVGVPTNGNWSLHYVNAVSGVRLVEDHGHLCVFLMRKIPPSRSIISFETVAPTLQALSRNTAKLSGAQGP